MKMKTFRIIIDILMVILLIMCIPSSRNNYVVRHIIEGALFTLLATIHVFIYRKWLVSVGKNPLKGRVKIKLQYGVDVALIAVWMLAIVAGFLAMGYSVWGAEGFFGFIRLHGVHVRVGVGLAVVHILQHMRQIGSYLKRKKQRSILPE